MITSTWFLGHCTASNKDIRLKFSTLIVGIYLFIIQHHKAIPLVEGYSLACMHTTHHIQVELFIHDVVLTVHAVKRAFGKLHDKNRFNTAGYFQSYTADLAKRLKEPRAEDIERMGPSDAFT